MVALGAVLKAAVVAGLIAGAVTVGFHSLLLEPLIDWRLGSPAGCEGLDKRQRPAARIGH
jgi:hypothetical protein